MPATIDVAEVRLGDDTRISYATAGPVDGVPVILLHGLSDSWHSFEQILADLPAGLRAIAPSFRGHGDSDRPPAGYSPAELAGDVVGVLDALDVERAIVAGHSLGATVAGKFASARPDRVAGLVLIGAFASVAGNPGVAELVEIVGQLEDPVDAEFIAEFQYSTLCRPVPESFMRTVLAESAKLPAHVWRAATSGFTATDLLGGMAGITAPTTLLWGDRDAFVPRADQELLLSAIADSHLNVYEETGHALHWEAPARFVSDLRAVVNRTLV